MSGDVGGEELLRELVVSNVSHDACSARLT